MTPLSTFTIRLEPDLRAALAAAAERERITMTDLMRRELRDAVIQRGFSLTGYVPPQGRR